MGRDFFKVKEDFLQAKAKKMKKEATILPIFCGNPRVEKETETKIRMENRNWSRDL